jgi:hypothetical protein
MLVPGAVNERWSVDFVSDQLANGRRFRVFNVVNDFTRECVLQIAPPGLDHATRYHAPRPAPRDAIWPARASAERTTAMAASPAFSKLRLTLGMAGSVRDFRSRREG